jgi:hypothetical protein
MAIPSNPHRTQIYAEFGPSTDNIINNQSLAQMYNIVFGGGSHSRDAFGGKEQATVTGLTTSTSNNVVTYFVNGLNTGGVETTIRLLYQSVLSNGNELATPDPNNWSVKATITETNDGNRSYSQTFTQGTWFLAIEVYNGFISEEGDWIFKNDNDDATEREITTDSSGNEPSLAPLLSPSAFQNSPYGYVIYWSTGDGVEPTSYYVEWDYKPTGGTYNGTWSTDGVLYDGNGNTDTTQYWGSSNNPKKVSMQPNPLQVSGTYKFRVTGQKPDYGDTVSPTTEVSI